MSTQKDDLDSDSQQKNSRPNVRPYQQEERLRNLYIERDLTQQQIADKFDVSVSTINNWLSRHDINKDRRSINKWTLPYGYVQYSQGGNFLAYQHQIEALRDFHITDVFAENTRCHHQLGSPVKLDMVANLGVVGHTQHLRRHAEGTATVEPDDMIPYLCGKHADDAEALSWNHSDGAPDHCLNTDDQGAGDE